MGAFSPEQVSYLDAPDSGGGVLDYSLMQNFMTYIAYHPEHVEDFSAADMSHFHAGGCELVSTIFCWRVAS